MRWQCALVFLFTSTPRGFVARRQGAQDPSPVTASDLPEEPSTSVGPVDTPQTIEPLETPLPPDFISTKVVTVTGEAEAQETDTQEIETPEEEGEGEEGGNEDGGGDDEEENTTEAPSASAQSTDRDVTSTVTVTWTYAAGQVETRAISATVITTLTTASTRFVTSTIASRNSDTVTVTRWVTVTTYAKEQAALSSTPALSPKRFDQYRPEVDNQTPAVARLAKRETVFHTVTKSVTDTKFSTTTRTQSVVTQTSTVTEAKIAVTTVIWPIARPTVTVESTLTVTSPYRVPGGATQPTTSKITLPTDPTSEVEPASTTSTSTPEAPAGGLTSTQKGGLGGGVGGVVLVCVALIGGLLWKRRRQHRAIPGAETPPPDLPEVDFGNIAPHHAHAPLSPPPDPNAAAMPPELASGQTNTSASQNGEASGSSSRTLPIPIPLRPLELAGRHASNEVAGPSSKFPNHIPTTTYSGVFTSGPLDRREGEASTSSEEGKYFTDVESSDDPSTSGSTRAEAGSSEGSRRDRLEDASSSPPDAEGSSDVSRRGRTPHSHTPRVGRSIGPRDQRTFRLAGG